MKNLNLRSVVVALGMCSISAMSALASPIVTQVSDSAKQLVCDRFVQDYVNQTSEFEHLLAQASQDCMEKGGHRLGVSIDEGEVLPYVVRFNTPFNGQEMACSAMLSESQDSPKAEIQSLECVARSLK